MEIHRRSGTRERAVIAAAVLLLAAIPADAARRSCRFPRTRNQSIPSSYLVPGTQEGEPESHAISVPARFDGATVCDRIRIPGPGFIPLTIPINCRSVGDWVCPGSIIVTVAGESYRCETENCVKTGERECDCDFVSTSCTPA